MKSAWMAGTHWSRSSPHREVRPLKTREPRTTVALSVGPGGAELLLPCGAGTVLDEPVSFDLQPWLLSRLSFLATARLLTFTRGHEGSCSVTGVAEARCVGPRSACLTGSIFRVVLF